ncbi:DUF1549 domain-containing protein [Armatimonas sp.]|uniref:DUF1549 domain-containing protein n=1 Tax=Armatimonas sp. TaxID=1872638 RepID=UPI003750E8B6
MKRLHATLLSASAALLAALAFASPQKPAPKPKLSFTNDVLPVLTKLGCNQGNCHGQQGGKGGFALSLRAWDPAFDFENIVRAASGRRIAASDPTRSLFLLKPLGLVPHAGGKLLTPYSEAHLIIQRWLAEGHPAPDEKTDLSITELTVTPEDALVRKPGDSVAISVRATYSDGTQRDVTRWSRFSSQNDAVASVDDTGKVRVRGPGESAILVAYSGEVKVTRVALPYAPLSLHPEATNPLDLTVLGKLDKLGLTPSPRCTDSEFLRRVSLDLTATLPTPSQTRQFLDSPDPQKRSKLIDKLLETDAYVDLRTLKLCDLLRVNGQFLSDEGADTYYRWIRQQVAQNTPFDKFTFALLTGKGSTFHTGPANYCRVAQTPEDLTEATASTFLGTRIGCARCHNHPFERWKQSDYYNFAAFFARYGRKGGPEFGEEQVYVKRDGEIANPRNKATAKMRFLGEKVPVAGEPFADRRETLATWLTGKDNRQFARVAANRLWSDFFGRGIVEPVDDFRLSNPPSNPKALEYLTDQLLASRFDLKAVTRLILNSETYQRSSQILTPTPLLPGNVRDDRYFARAYPRRLGAETLLDVVGQVTGKRDRFYPYPDGIRATQLRESRNSGYFLEIFGRPKREILCSCERSPQPNLSQSLHLVNSGSINDKLANGTTLKKLLTDFEPWAKPVRDARIVEELYYLTLCRPPSKAESEKLVAHIQKQKERKQGFEDALWALLNAEEFLFQK